MKGGGILVLFIKVLNLVQVTIAARLKQYNIANEKKYIKKSHPCTDRICNKINMAYSLE